jgi:hypothetical protein
MSIDMRAWGRLRFRKSRYRELEKLVKESANNIIIRENPADILASYGFYIQPDEDDDAYCLLNWEGEKYYEQGEELLRAMAPLLEEGSYLEGELNCEERFMWKVINGKLVDMVHVELWFEPGKVPVCPECGASLDTAKG